MTYFNNTGSGLQADRPAVVKLLCDYAGLRAGSLLTGLIRASVIIDVFFETEIGGKKIRISRMRYFRASRERPIWRELSALEALAAVEELEVTHPGYEQP